MSMPVSMRSPFRKTVLTFSPICLAAAVFFQLLSWPGSSPANQAGSGISVGSVDGWREQDIPIAATLGEQEAVLRFLDYDDALFRRFTKAGSEFELLVTYWNQGSMPFDKVAAHTPDACWPGSGWTLRSQTFPRSLRTAGMADPAMQYRVYARSGTATHTLFFHLVDGQPLSYGTLLPVPLWERMALDPREWFGRRREQFFVRLTSREPLESLLDDRGFRELLGQLAGLRLKRS